MNTFAIPLRRLIPALALTVLWACSTSEANEPTTRTSLGPEVAFGHAAIRSFVTTTDGRPTEVGVIVPEMALHGLPGADHEDGIFVHGHTTFETVLSLPEGNPTPFRHVLVNWNPGGHEPPGIYDSEHFDFHFYTVDNAWRLAIDEADPEFQAKADRQPAADFVPEGYILPEPLGFPRMGVHWVDPTSPELNGEPFTHTFIFGSWDGRLIFAEPMITKAFLDTKQTAEVELPMARQYETPGYYPSGYRVEWDEAIRAYRITLTGLVRKG